MTKQKAKTHIILIFPFYFSDLFQLVSAKAKNYTAITHIKGQIENEEDQEDKGPRRNLAKIK